jgi:ferredoxin
VTDDRPAPHDRPAPPFRARVDRAECFAFGFCLSTLPEVFSLDAEGKAVAADVDGDEASLRIAAEDCPRGAISLWRGDHPV